MWNEKHDESNPDLALVISRYHNAVEIIAAKEEVLAESMAAFIEVTRGERAPHLFALCAVPTAPETLLLRLRG